MIGVKPINGCHKGVVVGGTAPMPHHSAHTVVGFCQTQIDAAGS